MRALNYTSGKITPLGITYLKLQDLHLDAVLGPDGQAKGSHLGAIWCTAKPSPESSLLPPFFMAQMALQVHGWEPTALIWLEIN